MKVSIIIPFYKATETISKCFWGIKQQDYKKYEVIVSIDGRRKGEEEAITKALKDNKLTATVLSASGKKNRGASTARNRGAAVANGEILFFLDADCEIYPGMLRECVQKFEDPAIDFVYGDYRFEHKDEFFAMPFDAYQLQTMNYINTMSPVRKTVFEKAGGFNENLPYFQDWDLFFRMAKAGHKGKYINEFIFSTAKPTAKSISGRPGTLDEKASFFRKTNDIADKKLVVTSFGAPLQAIQRAKMLTADYVGPANGSRRVVLPSYYRFSNWEAAYMVGAYNETIMAFANHVSALNPVTNKIFHFIGSDVYQLRNKHNFYTIQNGIQKLIEDYKITCLANSPTLVRELAEMGIKSELLYTPVYNMNKYTINKRLPKQTTVAVYYSDSNPIMKYPQEGIDSTGGVSLIPFILDLTLAMPDVKFKFFGGMIKNETRANVEYCGRIPEDKMPEFIAGCTAVLRLTVHDGFPQLPIQFMVSGRQAITNFKDETFKFDTKIDFNGEDPTENRELVKSQVIDAIYALKDREKEFLALAPGIKAYYSELMSEKKYKEGIYKCLKK